MKHHVLIASAVLAMLSGGVGADPSAAAPLALPYGDTSQTTGPLPEVRTGSSVYYPTGTYWFTETDLQVNARSIPMAWDRTYRSNRIVKNGQRWVFASPADGPLGFGWTNLWICRIEDEAFVNEEGKYIYFAKDANGAYLPNTKAGVILLKTGSGYEVRESGGRTLLFTATGRLTAVRDKAGNAATLSYDASGRLAAIKDIMGRQVFTFVSNGDGRIESVTDLAGRTTTYAYDSTGNLLKVTQAGSNSATYTYNSYHGLTTKTNALNETYTIEYYPSWAENGVVAKVIDPVGTELIRQGQPATGHVNSFTYDFTNRTYYHTDPAGVTYMNIVNTEGQIVATYETTNGAQTLLTKVEYLDNRVTRTTDALGNVTSVQIDEWGNIIRRIDGAGYEWRYTFAPERRLMLTATNPLGTVTRYEYDGNGNRTKETVAAGTTDESVTTYTYNQYRERLSETRGASTTTYDYDDAGNMVRSRDPLGNETILAFDGAGNLLSRTVPLAGTTTFGDYDYRGNPGTITEPNGNRIVYTYDLLGRVKTATNQADGGVTRYEYVSPTGGSCTSCGGGNGVGKLAVMILPEGNRIDYSYDGAGNLVKVTDNDGNSIVYTCDNRGNRIKEEVKDATGTLHKTLSFQYDLLNRQKKIINPDAGYSEYGYDPRGNRAVIRNPNGNSTVYSYDAANRLSKIIQPGNITTSYGYDRRNNITSVTDANGNTTTYEYDKWNNVTRTESPDTGITTYTYDAGGNLKTKTDAKAITVTYVYDAASRLTNMIFPDSAENITYGFDTCLNGKGNLCTITNSSGMKSYEYTKKGQISRETTVVNGTVYVTEYGYDMNGNTISIRYPSGRVVRYDYTSDKVSRIFNDGAIVANDIVHKPFGGVQSITFGNGTRRTNTYDQQYRLTGITVTGVDNLSYDYDNNGNITSVTDHLLPVRNEAYGYDQLDRLTSATGPWGTLGYTYDGAGNRITENHNGVVTTYGYKPATNLLTTVSGMKNFNFTFDANGNTSSQETKTFIYNQNQRLIRVMDTAGEEPTTVAEYVHNGRGQRVKKTVNGQATTFIFDQRGRLLAESGSASADYLFLDGNLLAKFDGGTTHYVHTDQLGTPRKMTDMQNQVTWAMTAMPFGETIDISGAATLNFRFPGQWFDEETRLHYNYHRDYNPDLGRFVEADPIGIQRGNNPLYAYARNNPLKYSDSFGLYSAWVNMGGCGSFHAMIAGLDCCLFTAVNTRSGEACSVTSCCIRLGPGLYAGGGLAGGVTGAGGNCDCGEGLGGRSYGGGGDIGTGASIGGSVSVAPGCSVGGMTGIPTASGGGGISVGIDVCYTKVNGCVNTPDKCKKCKT